MYLVKSAASHFDRRETIRRTWGFENRFADVAIRTVFLLGRVPEDFSLQGRIEQEHQHFQVRRCLDFIKFWILILINIYQIYFFNLWHCIIFNFRFTQYNYLRCIKWLLGMPIIWNGPNNEVHWISVISSNVRPGIRPLCFQINRYPVHPTYVRFIFLFLGHSSGKLHGQLLQQQLEGGHGNALGCRILLKVIPLLSIFEVYSISSGCSLGVLYDPKYIVSAENVSW